MGGRQGSARESAAREFSCLRIFSRTAARSLLLVVAAARFRPLARPPLRAEVALAEVLPPGSGIPAISVKRWRIGAVGRVNPLARSQQMTRSRLEKLSIR